MAISWPLPVSLSLMTESPLPPSPLTTIQSLHSPRHRFSLKSGRSCQGLALRHGSLARGGICQGHLACLHVCHRLCCTREFQHNIFGHKNSAEMGRFCVSVLKCSMQSRGHLMRLPSCLPAVRGKARLAAAAAWF